MTTSTGTPLTEATNRLISLYQQGGIQAKEAEDQLVRSNQGLIYRIAKRYRTPEVPLSDLTQEGNLGLLRAIQLFNPSLGFCFSTYAAWWIRQKILRALHEQGRIIRFSEQRYQRVGRFRRVYMRLWQEKGHAPCQEEIADEMHLSLAQTRLLWQDAFPLVSLHEPLKAGEATTRGELLADLSPSPEEQVLNQIMFEHIERIFITAGLTIREREVIRRCILDNERQTNVANELAISPTRIGQIRQQALDKLKAVPNIALLLRP